MNADKNNQKQPTAATIASLLKSDGAAVENYLRSSASICG
jgi:hypothetical protein